MVVKTVQNDVQDRSAGQGEQHRQFHHWETVTGLLRTGLRESLLVLRRVGQLGGGAVNDFYRPAVELAAGAGAAVGDLGGGVQGFFQSLSGLEVGRSPLLKKFSLPRCPIPLVVNTSPRKFWGLSNRHS